MIIKNLVFTVLLIVILQATVYCLDLEFIGDISETYDDNIFVSDDKVSDYITKITAGFGINHEGKSQQLELLGHVNQEVYYENSDQNRFTQDFYLDYNLIINLTRKNIISISDKFEYFPETQVYANTFGRSGYRDKYFRNIFNITNSLQFFRKLALVLQYTNRYTINYNDDVLNSYSNDGSAALVFSLSSYIITSLFYSYAKTEYENDESITEQRGNLIQRLYFTKQLYLEGSYGRQSLKTHDGNESKNTIYSVSVIDDIDKKNSIILNFTKEQSVTEYTNEIFNNWRIAGDFKRQVSRRFNLLISAFKGKGDFQPSGATTEFIGLKTSFTYYFTENISGSCEYSFLNSKSETRSNNIEYQRNVFMLSLKAQY
jgi:hypothetical protein